MPHGAIVRDPDTGQFVSVSDLDTGDVDVESVSFAAVFDLDAADLTGSAGSDLPDQGNFDGELLLDYDDIVDRHEVAVLLGGEHHLTVMTPSTQTADGTARAVIEVSTSPTSSAVAVGSTAATAVTNPSGSLTVEAAIQTDDSVDVIGRVLNANTYSPFSDGATGVGGAGGVGVDTVQLAEYARHVGLVGDRRDELFLHGTLEASNIDDGGLVAHLQGQHYYAVGEDLV